MTDEEIDRMADSFVKAQDFTRVYSVARKAECGAFWKYGYLAGLKAGRPKWHKVADGDLPKGEKYGKNSIHRNIYLKDRYGNLYTGNYYPKDETHAEDSFAVEVLEWGFQGSQFCKKGQIAEWCEIPKYTEE